MRRLFGWVFRVVLGLFILAVVALVAVLLLLDTITREILVSRLRAQTGMEVKLSAVHVGLLSPTLSIEGLKLYNTADFGGSVCLDMPELHIEYDPAALRSRQLHLTLLRLDLAEIAVVVDKSGRNNFERLKRKSHAATRRRQPGGHVTFTDIDVLNVTLGKFLVSNLASGREEEIDFGIKNQILRDVKTEADLAPLGLATLSRGKVTSKADAGVNLNQLLDSLLKTP